MFDEVFYCGYIDACVVTGWVVWAGLGAEKLSADDHHFVQEGLVPFVVDAVYAMAYALHGMQRHLCDKEPVCEAMIPLAGPELLRRIRDVDFIGQCRRRWLPDLGTMWSPWHAKGYIKWQIWPFISNAILLLQIPTL